MTEYVDVTPTWIGILPIILTALRDATPEGQRIAGEEIRRMARLADSLGDAVREAEEWERLYADAKRDLDICLAALIDIEDEYNDPLEVARAARAKLTGTEAGQ